MEARAPRCRGLEPELAWISQEEKPSESVGTRRKQARPGGPSSKGIGWGSQGELGVVPIEIMLLAVSFQPPSDLGGDGIEAGGVGAG